MWKNIAITFILLGFSLASPFQSHATLFNYTVSGTLENTDDHTQFTVSGNIIIDDTLRLWAGSASDPAPEAPPELGNNQYSYFIPKYSLKITETLSPHNSYDFLGTSGNFYIERPAPLGIGDLMWFLDNGAGSWNEWTGENFYWYHEDTTLYDLYTEMAELAPIIRLTSLDYRFNDPIFSDSVNTDIVLTRFAPVPEPTSILLSALGLFAMGAYIKRKHKIGHILTRKFAGL